MQFKVFLAALRERGRAAEAEAYEKAVTQRFTGVLGSEAVGALDVAEVAAVLKMVKQLFSAPTPLQQYVAELQARGFNVSVGEKYRKCL